MKLQTRINLAFLGMMVLLSLIAGLGGYWGIREVVREETDEALVQNLNWIKGMGGVDVEAALRQPDTKFEALPGFHGKEKIVFGDTTLPDGDGDEEDFRYLRAQTEWGGEGMEITLLKPSVDEEDLRETLGMTFGTAFGLVFLGAVFFQFLFVRRMWRPFEKILEEVRDFELEAGKKADFGRPKAEEFRRLAGFLEDMTEKVRADYRNLKQFTENASHEMQTPLALIQSKLDRLVQSGNLSAEESEWVQSALGALWRLSLLNKSLLLLSKIQNRQFPGSENLNLTEIARRLSTEYTELAELKELRFNHSIAPNLHLNANPVLLESLLTNLLANAVRYCPQGGAITFELSEGTCLIRNTGEKALPDKQVFERFWKGNQGKEGSGLGLAIVKEICSFYGWEIGYSFSENQHQFSWTFTPETL